MKITKVLVSVLVAIGFSVSLVACVDVEETDVAEVVEGEGDDPEAAAAYAAQTQDSESAEHLESAGVALARLTKDVRCGGPSYGNCTVGETAGTLHYYGGSWYCCTAAASAY